MAMYLNNSNRINPTEFDEVEELKKMLRTMNTYLKQDPPLYYDEARALMDRLLAGIRYDQFQLVVPPNVRLVYQRTPATQRVYHVTMYYNGIALN